MNDLLLSWLVCLLPRRVCAWIWDLDVPLGDFAPHVFGRMIGVDAKRVRRA